MRIFIPKTKLAILLSFTFICSFALATTYPINVTLSGAQEIPSNGSTGTGTLIGTYNDVTDSLIYTVTFSGLSANVTAAHFHAGPPGIAAPVYIPITGIPFPTGVMSGSFTDTLVLTAGQEDTLKRGLLYFNIHTTAIPGGEIRAQIFLQDPTFVLPDIVCPKDTTVGNDAGICTRSLSFAATASAGTPAPAFYYRIGNTTITSPYVFPLGTTKVIATALNSAGADSCSFSVTVKDTQPPVVTCPANITRPNDPGKCGAVVDFIATATDNCSKVTISYQPQPGSFFPVGDNLVTVTATDSSGNKATCTFTVKVNDVEPPVIKNVALDPPILWPPNHTLRDVTVNYTSSDNCPGPITCQLSVTNSEPGNGKGDGNTDPDWVIVDDHHIKLRAERAGNGRGRAYTVTITCTDQYGNSASKTVADTVPHSLSNARIRRLVFLYWNHGNGNGHRMANLTDPVDINKNMIIMNEEDPERSSLIRVYPNPSRDNFILNIETANNTDKLSLRLYDESGRLVEARTDISGSQVIRFGNNLRKGFYFAQISQGMETKVLKLIKLE